MRKFFASLITAMLIAGCKGGAGDSGLGSLFGSGSSGSSGSSFSSGAGSSGLGADLVINPEPSSLALLGVGLAGLAMAKLRKRKKT